MRDYGLDCWRWIRLDWARLGSKAVGKGDSVTVSLTEPLSDHLSRIGPCRTRRRRGQGGHQLDGLEVDSARRFPKARELHLDLGRARREDRLGAIAVIAVIAVIALIAVLTVGLIGTDIVWTAEGLRALRRHWRRCVDLSHQGSSPRGCGEDHGVYVP